MMGEGGGKGRPKKEITIGGRKEGIGRDREGRLKRRDMKRKTGIGGGKQRESAKGKKRGKMMSRRSESKVKVSKG